MAKKLREYEDNYHEVMSKFYDLTEEYNDRNVTTIKRQLGKLIEKDPDFLDSYLFLYQIYQDEGKLQDAEKLLDEAYNRAIKSITDKKGNWPDIMEWEWLENRHITRTILSKAIALWRDKESDDALEILRKLLRTNPRDNVGARDYILAIRMNMSFEEFEDKFDRGGYYDGELMVWFEKNYKKFPDEFDWGPFHWHWEIP